MVIAFVGAGSYVFGPSVLQQLFESPLDDVEVRLIDPQTTATEALARAAAAEAVRRGRRLTFMTQRDFVGALDGAEAVIHSAAPGMRSTFVRNRQIIAETYPEHLVSEFGGVHGIVYSTVQVRFVARLAAEMRRACPRARLMVSANPLTRVVDAARREGVQAIGFCSVAMNAYREVGRLLFGLDEAYPFAEARSRVELASAGTNHLSWVVRLRDRASGENLLPRLAAAGDPRSARKTLRLLVQTGYLAAPGDDHILDFLPVDGDEPVLESTSHGDDDDRARRQSMLDEVARGTRPFADLDEHPAWEFPVAALAALAGGPPLEVVTLNLPNAGQIPQLPEGAIVETAARFDAHGVHPLPADLPAPVVPLNENALAVTAAIVDWALDGREDRLRDAVHLDPTIVDEDRGWAAVQRCLDALPDGG